jgi:D-beta-D-heptose 7-phosphate kinase/D-beta-D-heptose 1-phosphate adenosyltransferase
MTNLALIRSIEQYPFCKLICIGDVMVDHFVYGDVGRISPEAPIPVVSIDREESMLGGAGNVVRNLTSLGAKVIFLTVTGDDSAADSIAALLQALPNCEPHIIRDPSRRTSVKRRYLAHNQQLLRVDSETTTPLAKEHLDHLLATYKSTASGADIAILSDYGKGVLSENHAQPFIAAGREAGKPVYVDPKGHDFTRYRGASLIKPNLKELAEATQMPLNTDVEVEAAARRILHQTISEAILVTRGAGGMMLVRNSGCAVSFHSRAREVYDVSGAGDTVAAVVALGTAAGLELEDAVDVACVAAGLVVAKVGTATLTQRELLHELESSGSLPADLKILAREEAVHRIQLWKKTGFRIGFAIGCFLSLSASQVVALRHAKDNCEKLVVWLTARNALQGSPAEHDRAVLLAAMACVDLVVMFEGGDLEDLVGRLSPDAVTLVT